MTRKEKWQAKVKARAECRAAICAAGEAYEAFRDAEFEVYRKKTDPALHKCIAEVASARKTLRATLAAIDAGRMGRKRSKA